MSSATPVPFSIVVPAKDEEATIGAVLREICHLTTDLIVVDGASTDRTVEIASSYGARILRDEGRGKGDAVRAAIQAVRCPIIVFIDADGSHDPLDIPKLVAPIVEGEADLVMGSRMLGGSEELFGSFPQVVRMVGSIIISLTINYRYGLRLTDYQNGFRAIRADVARVIGLTSRITTIEQEMAMKCLRYGFRVTERPAHEFPRRGGVSKVSVRRRAPQYVWNLLCGVIGPRRRLPAPVMSTLEPNLVQTVSQEPQDA